MSHIKLFEDKNIRSHWNEEDEHWYFAVVDIVAALTDSANPTDYLNKIRKRDIELNKGWGQIVHTLPIETNGGKQRVNCANVKGIFRIIQSISFTENGTF